MLTKITIRNFKRFAEEEVELGNPVVFIGPNNSGKTAALQALALWDVGVKRWGEKHGFKDTIPQQRPGATINRRDLIAIPLPNAKLMWRDLHVRDVQRIGDKPQTQNIRIEITVEGVTRNKHWRCGMEFDYANEESIYSRPLRDKETLERIPVPEEAAQVQVAFLPPMSGLAANELRLDPGAINVRIGEGRTAEVLRNLCYRLIEHDSGDERWQRLNGHLQGMFGVTLDLPQYIPERGELAMTYREQAGTQLDLSSSGRGLQQVLLLLAYIYANPGAVLLLDEPDAHLEILRQRQIYHLITESARQQGAQIIAASHSEVVLNEAADRDVVIAFVGKPHRIDDRGSQLLKALREIGYDQYYQAEQTGWVLYLEGATDLAILRQFAQLLNHLAADCLERPFVYYLGHNQPNEARRHFYGLREAKPDLVGIVITDRLDTTLDADFPLVETMWRRREIENYLCYPDVLLEYAARMETGLSELTGPIFEPLVEADRERRQQVMQVCINDLVPSLALRDPDDRWWRDVKASDEFLDRLFELYFERLGLPNLMQKSDYHVLAALLPGHSLDIEIREKLDRIVEVAQRASPREG